MARRAAPGPMPAGRRSGAGDVGPVSAGRARGGRPRCRAAREYGHMSGSVTIAGAFSRRPREQSPLSRDLAARQFALDGDGLIEESTL